MEVTLERRIEEVQISKSKPPAIRSAAVLLPQVNSEWM